MRPFLHGLCAALFLGACSAEMSMQDGAESPTGYDAESTTAADLQRQIYVDVLPANVFDADSELRILPQTVGPFAGDNALDVGTIALNPPTTIGGVITGQQVTPMAAGAELPFVDGPIAAEVVVTRATRSVQTYRGRTDVDGRYDTIVVSDQYDMHIIPDDPTIPILTHHRNILAPVTQDFDIPQGQAIWGTVSYPDGLKGDPFQVYVVNADGVRSATATTDDDGQYLIHVLPESGPWHVVCAGRPDGRDPILTSDSIDNFEASDTGFDEAFVIARVDFDYPGYAPAAISGRVVDGQGNGVDNAAVRFTAKSLVGYDDLDARLQFTRTTIDGGNFDALLIAGNYLIEIAPEGDLSPTLFEATVTGNMPLGSITLGGLLPVSGIVMDELQRPIPDAHVTCKEIGYGGREWETYSEARGVFALDLPTTNVACALATAGSDLALTTQIVNPITFDGDMTVHFGTNVQGVVQLRGEAEAFAVVEIRDGLGELLGSTLTDDTGFFRVKVDVPAPE